MSLINDSFSAYFNDHNISLPDPIPSKGTVKASGWTITYRLFKDENQAFYLDFFAQHRMTNSRHVRILDSGEIQTLESYRDALIFNEQTGDNWNKALAAKQIHNEKVTDILKAKELI